MSWTGVPWWATEFGVPYVELYADLTTPEATRDEICFLSRLLERRSRVLDVACGYGRHALGLTQAGHDVVGLDRSAELIALAGAHASRTGGGRPAFVVADCRQVPFERAFDAAICMFTSFGYFRCPQDNESVLASVARSLRTGGAFLIDLNNPASVRRFISQRDRSRRTPETEVTCSYTRRHRDGMVVHTAECLDLRSLRWSGVSRWRSSDRYRAFRSDVQLYSLADISRMLLNVGLVPERVWGGFDGSDYYPVESRRLIVLSRKT